MRELTYFVATSLDGKIARPDGDFSDFPTEGDHVEMIMRDYTDTLPGPALDALGLTADRARFDTVLMGWNTYAVGVDVGVTSPYPHLRQYVFSRQERSVPDDLTVVSSDPAEFVSRLHHEAGAGIWLCGGGQLAAALLGQIDRLVLKVNPILLGDGIDMLARTNLSQRFALVASTPFASGVVVNEYTRASN